MSLVLHFNLLRNNIRTSCSVGFLKQHAIFSSGKLPQPKSYEKRHFSTNLTEAVSWHKTDPGSRVPTISSLWIQQSSGHDLQLYLSLMLRLLVIYMGVIELLSLHFVTFLEERIPHFRLSLILNGMFPNTLPRSIRFPLNWSAGMVSQGEKNLVNLEALGKRYDISYKGPYHRTMGDVEALCEILPNITKDLKLTCDGLMNEAMRFSDARKVSLK